MRLISVPSTTAEMRQKRNSPALRSGRTVLELFITESTSLYLDKTLPKKPFGNINHTLLFIILLFTIEIPDI